MKLYEFEGVLSHDWGTCQHGSSYRFWWPQNSYG